MRADILQPAVDALLGRGLPAPDDAIRDAGWTPDAPWSWCARCGGGGCPACVAGGGAPRPAHATVTRLGVHAGALRAWVIDVKHARWESMGERLGAELGRQLSRCGVARPDDDGTVLVPVPTPWLRARERGIDHALVIASAAARALGVGIVRPLRQCASGTQVGRASRAGRSVRRARFDLRGGRARCRASVAGRHAIVVDDVRTTGATLAEVGAWIRWLGAARVDAAVLSVTGPARSGRRSDVDNPSDR